LSLASVGSIFAIGVISLRRKRFPLFRDRASA
jgi:hypothetical protein